MSRADEALEHIKHLDGLFVGLLDERELDALNFCCSEGLATRSYEGVGGFMGLAKVRIAKPVTP